VEAAEIRKCLKERGLAVEYEYKGNRRARLTVWRNGRVVLVAWREKNGRWLVRVLGDDGLIALECLPAYQLSKS